MSDGDLRQFDTTRIFVLRGLFVKAESAETACPANLRERIHHLDEIGVNFDAEHAFTAVQA